jgi:hypothetical protein
MPDILKYGDEGERVKELQRLLNANSYRKPRKLLEVDGIMGPLTCGAVQSQKFWEGYPDGEVTPVAGDKFMAFITEEEPLPGEYRARRQARLQKVRDNVGKQSDADKMRLRALAYAQGDVGRLEGPSNLIVFNTWWCGGGNDGGAYCVRAGSYWFDKAGSKAVVRGSRWENTDAMLADAAAGRNGLHLTDDPDPGNGFVIDFDGRSDPDHFGLFVKDLGNGWFRSLEANATLSSGRQGVGYHTREYRHCWFIVVER